MNLQRLSLTIGVVAICLSSMIVAPVLLALGCLFGFFAFLKDCRFVAPGWVPLILFFFVYSILSITSGQWTSLEQSLLLFSHELRFVPVMGFVFLAASLKRKSDESQFYVRISAASIAVALFIGIAANGSLLWAFSSHHMLGFFSASVLFVSLRRASVTRLDLPDLLATVFVASTLVLSGSRASLFAVAFSLVFTCGLLSPARLAGVTRLLTSFRMIVLLVFMGAATTYSGLPVDRYLDGLRSIAAFFVGDEFSGSDGVLNESERNAAVRVEVWDDAIRLVRQRPIFGSGAATADDLLIDSREVVHTDFSTHNLFLHAVLELGIIGLIALLVCIWALVVGERKRLAPSNSPMTGIIAAALFAGLFGNTFFSAAVLLPVAMGSIASAAGGRPERYLPFPSRGRLGHRAL